MAVTVATFESCVKTDSSSCSDIDYSCKISYGSDTSDTMDTSDSSDPKDTSETSNYKWNLDFSPLD